MKKEITKEYKMEVLVALAINLSSVKDTFSEKNGVSKENQKKVIEHLEEVFKTGLSDLFKDEKLDELLDLAATIGANAIYFAKHGHLPGQEPTKPEYKSIFD